MTTPRQRLLHLRVLALQSVRTGYEPHRDLIQSLCQRGARRTGAVEDQINRLAWKYRRQISPELVPHVGDVVRVPLDDGGFRAVVFYVGAGL